MVTLDILSCLEGSDEIQMVADMIVDSKFNYYEGETISSDDIMRRLTLPVGEDAEKRKLEISLPYSLVPEGEEDIIGDDIASLKALLSELGVPWVYQNIVCQEIEAFDGVRVSKVDTDEEGSPYVDMRAVRSIIDMLEKGDEVRAIVYANQFWVETNVLNMWRNGMEGVVAYSVGAPTQATTTEHMNDDHIVDTEIITGDDK